MTTMAERRKEIRKQDLSLVDDPIATIAHLQTCSYEELLGLRAKHNHLTKFSILLDGEIGRRLQNSANETSNTHNNKNFKLTAVALVISSLIGGFSKNGEGIGWLIISSPKAIIFIFVLIIVYLSNKKK